MLSFFPIVGLALYAETITSLPTLPSLIDAELLAHLGLDPNQFSSVGTDPGALFPSLDSSSSFDAEALLSPELALDASSSASDHLLASQDYLDPGCDNTPKGKRETGGAETSCPAYFINPGPPGAAQAVPRKSPKGEQQRNPAPQKPTNVKPNSPESRGDLRLTPSDPIQNPFGEKDKDPQCPRQYKYTVCGIIEPRYNNMAAQISIYDADLVINSGFGFGMVVRPGKKINSFLSVLNWKKSLPFPLLLAPVTY